jgi:hypothetical protein
VKRPLLLISLAWLMHLMAWFVPVVKDGATFPQGLPGWEAFRVAACSFWPCNSAPVFNWYFGALAAISALGTILFIVGSPYVVWRGTPSLQRVSAWAAALCFVVNIHSYVAFGNSRSDLRMGYFLWWFSFAVLAVGIFDLSSESGSSAASR